MLGATAHVPLRKGLSYMKIGMLGFGSMGKTHTWCLKNIPFFYSSYPEIELVGVCAAHYEKALAAKEAYGYRFAAKNEDEIIYSDEIDTVDVCTPNCFHYETLKKIILAGKNVYCEKPLCVTAEEAEEIARLASSGMPFEMVCSETERYMKRTALLFQLNSLENLTKNGRVSKMAGMTAKLLGIHMIGIASDVGTVQPLHKCRGTEKTYRLVLQEMRERGFTGGRVILGHAFQEKGADMMKSMILEEFPSARITVMPLSGLCCYYAEEGGLLIGFERG